MHTLKRLVIGSICVVSMWTGSSLALAQTASTVEPLIQQGIELRKAHQDEAALKVFLQAEPQAPEDVRLLLHITTAAQASGKWILAHRYMQRVSRHADDPYYQRHQEAISLVIEAIKRRVGELTVEGGPPGAEVRLNGNLLGTLPVATPFPVEAGTYTMEVTEPGYYKLRRPVEVAGGGLTREVATLNLRPVGEPPQSRGALGRGAALGDPPIDEPVSAWNQPWVHWTFFGLGVASAGVSGVALYLRESQAEEWNDNATCLDAGRPNQSRQAACGDVRSNVKNLETVSVVAGVAALAFGSAALTHWLATSPGEDDQSAKTPVACAPGLLAVSCTGSF